MSIAPGTRVLLTGASGFIGRHLSASLQSQPVALRTVVRQPPAALAGGADEADRVEVISLDLAAPPTDAELDALLADVDLCYHVAGLAHAAAASSAAALNDFNAVQAQRLYQAAVRQGCGAFVWLSSSKVLGDVSRAPLPVTAAYAPVGAYARSKVAAEQGLQALAQADTKLIIVRPPLVYGPGVTANFRSLLAVALRGWPLPLAAATAPRSLVGVTNLCAALTAAAQASAGIYHVTDPVPVSVAELLRSIGRCSGASVRLWPCPPALLSAALSLVGRREAFDRLFSPLVLDSADSERRLNWSPAHSLDAQLQETVSWYLSQR